MTLIDSYGLTNVTLRRMRYIHPTGWIESSDTFQARISPKWADSINRTTPITFEEVFLPCSIFRDNSDTSSFINPVTFTYPGSAEFITESQTGTELWIGDRVKDVNSGKIWFIHNISEFRDAELQHDEIIAKECSHLDMKYIERVQILRLKTSPTNFDPIIRQNLAFDINNYDIQEAWGLFTYWDREMYYRDKQQQNQMTDRGRHVTEPYLVHLDSSWDVDEKCLILARDVVYKIDFIRETMYMVMGIAIKPYYELGANKTLIDNRPRIMRYD